jgi:hypothetical protein
MEALLGLACSSVGSFPVNLIQDHHESRDEHVVDVREHGDAERVLPQQHIRDGELPVHLQHRSPNGKHVIS